MCWGHFWRGSSFNKHLVCSHFLATKVIVHDHSLQSRVVVCQRFVSSILEKKRYEICVVLFCCVQCIFSYGFWKTFRIKNSRKNIDKSFSFAPKISRTFEASSDMLSTRTSISELSFSTLFSSPFWAEHTCKSRLGHKTINSN